MGGSVPAQVTWMNSVVAEFHQEFPQYASTQDRPDFAMIHSWTVMLAA
jgi:hypothetical protein